MGGILCLGNKETLKFTDAEDDFDILSEKHRVYRLKYPAG